MAFGRHDAGDDADDGVMNEINMTPLVDVMLVLLIIFIVTVPVMKQSVNVDLPRASSQREVLTPETIRLSVDAAGTYYWNGTRVDDATLDDLLRAQAGKGGSTEIHIQGDKAVRYERVARLMAAVQRAGLHRIGFITEPEQ